MHTPTTAALNAAGAWKGDLTLRSDQLSGVPHAHLALTAPLRRALSPAEPLGTAARSAGPLVPGRRASRTRQHP